MTGFKATALSNVQVGVDQRVSIDVTLEVGQMTESVKIEASTPLLQTSSSELGTTVHSEQIQTLPLNGRNFVSLTSTVPGVLRGIPGANIDGAGSLAWRASASFSANGQRARDNNYMLDGVDNNETWLQTVVLFPSVDALDEFKLQTSTYSAEFGRSTRRRRQPADQVGHEPVSRQRLRVPAQRRVRRQQLLQQPRRRARSRTSARTSSAAPFGGADLQGQDVLLRRLPGPSREAGPDVPFHGADGEDAHGRLLGADRASSTTRRRTRRSPATSFRANRSIRSRRTSSISSTRSPTPPARGTPTTGQTINNYLINPIKERQDNQFDVKVDHNLTQNNRFFTRYSYEKTHRLQPASLPHGDAGVTFGAGDGNIKAQSLAFNDTHTLSSNWLNEFRFGWSSIKFLNTLDRLRHQPRQGGRPARHQLQRPLTSAMTPDACSRTSGTWAPTATSRSSRTRTTSSSSTT